MKGLRLGVTFIIVLVIFLLSLFQMQLRGYEKLGRVEEWTIYFNEDNCGGLDFDNYETFLYTYSISCLNDDAYIVKNGFEEHSLLEALDEGYFEVEDLEEIVSYTRRIND